MRTTRATALAILALGAGFTSTMAQSDKAPELAIRCDDVGMCHAGNMAVKKLIASGMPFSTSVMIACPWYLEAVEMLKDQDQVSVGIHLTLNSEWQHYKWGPVLGPSAVPTLVDENGHFHTTSADFAAANVDLDEVEKELRAQIQRALDAGLEVDYLDYHMLTAVSTPELTAIVEDLAKEYGLGLSRYFGERSTSLWDVAPERKLVELLDFVPRVKPGRPTLLVIHLGIDGPEMAALIDINNPEDPARVGIHRQAELDALLSSEFRQAIADHGIELVNYGDLIDRYGLDSMQRPQGEPGYSMGDTEAD
jgi:predicted glycoside hydrolase/deacetylase ChbG (UPF0249 family)